MTDDNPMIQKLKGKFMQAKGELEKATGNEVAGTIDQIRGKAEEEIAEARLRFNRKKTDLKTDEQIAREQMARDNGE